MPNHYPVEPHGHSPWHSSSRPSGATSRPNAGAFIHGQSLWPSAAGVTLFHSPKLFCHLNLILHILSGVMGVHVCRRTSNAFHFQNKFRILNLLLILALVLFPMLFLGNGSINLLVIFLLVSGVVSSISEIFLLPQMLKLFEKIIK